MQQRFTLLAVIEAGANQTAVTGGSGVRNCLTGKGEASSHYLVGIDKYHEGGRVNIVY